MPGILPMKIIKVGSSSQSRVAQACDRCRSKKIRCDGITPCCTQCANVGFECKTSDKLSRRAFPRGYTESLEERVRQLETEVKDLKALLDEKDEKIDLLSKFHSFSKNRNLSGSLGASKPNNYQTPESDGVEEREDIFSVKQPNSLTKISSRVEPYWAGASSSISFLDVFKEKAAVSGRAVPLISPRSLFPGKAPASRRPVGGHARRPPRLISDRLVNVFLQEFAPLFPVLYRPAFLQRYKDFTEGVDSLENHHAIAQVNLVLSIAATACDFGKEHLPAFDNHWQSALNTIICDNSLATLQCLVLAQLCCLCKGDSNRVLHYAGVAVIMSRRLGLHKAQAGLSLDTLSTELRKRTFWCLYTFDVFTAASLGLPRLIKDDIIQTELPINVDDEDLVERRANASNPETKVSASLAMFALAKIFGRVIDSVYQAPSMCTVSVQLIAEISEALDSWRDSLSPHLRLTFAQDKPSTRVTGDRSPLLSLAYYHVRALSHRPLAASDLGPKAVPSAIALADSCKHIVQIIQLLDERRMSFTLPLAKDEVLVAAGLGLLYQGLTINSNPRDTPQHTSSSLVSENKRLVCGIMSILDASNAPCATDFKALACSLITVDGIRARRSPDFPSKSISPRSSISQSSRKSSYSESQTTNKMGQTSAPKRSNTESPKHLANYETQATTIAQRRAMVSPGKIQFPTNQSLLLAHQYNLFKGGLTPTKSEPSLRAASIAQYNQAQQQAVENKRTTMILPAGDLPNLDYLPLGNVSPVPSLTPVAQKGNIFDAHDGTQWEHLLGCLNNSPTVMGDPNMGASPPVDIFSPEHSIFDGGASVIGLNGLDWTCQDPTSATAWTDSTGVPSVFDDSGASLTSGDDGRSSVDVSRNASTSLGKEIDFLTSTSVYDLQGSLADDTTGLQALEVGLQL